MGSPSSHVTIRRRSRDGVIEIVPNVVSLLPSERAMVIASILLSSVGAFAAGLVPGAAVGMAAACCASAELTIALERYVARRFPRAELVELPEPFLRLRPR